MRYPQVLLLIYLCVAYPSVDGYELATHGRLTKQAFLKSFLLNGIQFRGVLGLDLSEDLLTTYFDSTANELNIRSARDDFMLDKQARRLPALDEAGVINISAKTYPYSPIGWLMRGAIREDDVPVFFGGNPQDDPYGQIFRVTHLSYGNATQGINDGQTASPQPIVVGTLRAMAKFHRNGDFTWNG